MGEPGRLWGQRRTLLAALVRAAPEGHACGVEKHRRQVSRRLGAPRIRQVLGSFRREERSAVAAAEELGLGRTAPPRTAFGQAGLCRVLLPRPVRDAVDYANVPEITVAMALEHDAFTADQRDYFDLLCALLEDYDREHVRWSKLPVRARLQHLLDQAGLSAADPSRLLGGSRNLGAMILRGDRNLTLPHVRKLAAHFKVSPDLFI